MAACSGRPAKIIRCWALQHERRSDARRQSRRRIAGKADHRAALKPDRRHAGADRPLDCAACLHPGAHCARTHRREPTDRCTAGLLTGPCPGARCSARSLRCGIDVTRASDRWLPDHRRPQPRDRPADVSAPPRPRSQARCREWRSAAQGCRKGRGRTRPGAGASGRTVGPGRQPSCAANAQSDPLAVTRLVDRAGGPRRTGPCGARR